MKCAICLYVRNEERNIQEWIAYHRVIGFDAFLIYDNGSTDFTLQKVEQARSIADIRAIDWSGHTDGGAQNSCYTDCCNRFGAEFDWIAFIDSDEYITNDSNDLIQSLLVRNSSSSGIALNWAFFGSNGLQEFPNGLVIEAFDRRADHSDTRYVTFDASRHVKMLIRPSHMIRYLNPHCFELSGSIMTPSGHLIEWGSPGISKEVEVGSWRINHYFTRSRAHWNLKMSRGYRDIARTDYEFGMYDRNEIRDRSAAALVEPVLSLLDAIR